MLIFSLKASPFSSKPKLDTLEKMVVKCVCQSSIISDDDNILNQSNAFSSRAGGAFLRVGRIKASAASQCEWSKPFQLGGLGEVIYNFVYECAV